jgi:hypothetical protein
MRGKKQGQPYRDDIRSGTWCLSNVIRDDVAAIKIIFPEVLNSSGLKSVSGWELTSIVVYHRCFREVQEYLTKFVVHFPYWESNNTQLFYKFHEFYETWSHWRVYYSPSLALSWARLTKCTLAHIISLTSLVLLFLPCLGLHLV